MVMVTIPVHSRNTPTALYRLSRSSLLVTLIPTTIGALLSAIGIAGMDRLVRATCLPCPAAR